MTPEQADERMSPSPYRRDGAPPKSQRFTHQVASMLAIQNIRGITLDHQSVACGDNQIAPPVVPRIVRHFRDRDQAGGSAIQDHAAARNYVLGQSGGEARRAPQGGRWSNRVWRRVDQ